MIDKQEFSYQCTHSLTSELSYDEYTNENDRLFIERHSNLMKPPDFNTLLLFKYSDNLHINLLDAIIEATKPVYEKYRWRYNHRLSDRVIYDEYLPYEEKIPPPRHFGFFDFMWKKNLEFVRKPEIFAWPI